MKSTLTVSDFYTRNSEVLLLSLIGAATGLDRPIKEPTINRPGLALAGFFDYFASKRIQVLGSAELAYLRKLPPDEAQIRVREMLRRRPPCIVIARNCRPPKYLLAEAETARICVFRTTMVTMNFINAATLALEAAFAPTITEHGSMVDILGVGTLVKGSSGIGKSECVLGLLERGYPLISDDVTRLRLIDGKHLVGTAPELTRHHMEVRGLGIINVSSMFGIRAVRMEKALDLIVTLKDWQELEEPDRMGLDRQHLEILGVPVPHIAIPVRMGRDLSRLVEVAALDYKLRSMGQDSAKEFNARLLSVMQNNH